MEKRERQSKPVRQKVSANLFSIVRSNDGASEGSSGVVIQIRLKSPAGPPGGKLLTRRNTEFWLSASD